MAQSFEQLLAKIGELEGELQENKTALESQARELSVYKQKNDQSAKRSQALKTLVASLAVQPDLASIYQLACQSSVQSGWDVAVVVALAETGATVLASHGTTEKQVTSLPATLAKSALFTQAYTKATVLDSYSIDEKSAVQLRALFAVDEAVAVPLSVSDRVYACLVVGRVGKDAHERAPETEFLQEMALHVAAAVHSAETMSGLEQQNNQLRQMDQMKNTFIAITSHQLRTPLSVIKWILSVLQTDPQIHPLQSQLEMVNQAYESNERLVHVVNDMLNVTRIQDGRLPYTPQDTDVKPILADIKQEAEKTVEGRGLTIQASFADDLPNVQADPLLYREAIQNIVTNAIYYSGSSGKIILKSWHDKGTVSVSVTNTGPGISKEEAPKVFDQFFRGQEATKAFPNGSGLGLYLSKAIITEHGGEITFTSTPGKETVFTVTIPLKKEK